MSSLQTSVLVERHSNTKRRNQEQLTVSNRTWYLWLKWSLSIRNSPPITLYIHYFHRRVVGLRGREIDIYHQQECSHMFTQLYTYSGRTCFEPVVVWGVDIQVRHQRCIDGHKLDDDVCVLLQAERRCYIWPVRWRLRKGRLGYAYDLRPPFSSCPFL